MSQSSEQIEARVAMYAIALRAVQLDIAVKSAMGIDPSLMLARQMDIEVALEEAADEWLSLNRVNAEKIYTGL